MITRKIGKLLRGKATPFQVFTASVLGSLIAFVPGFQQGPGLVALYVALLLLMNANLGAALLVAVPAKLAALGLVPVSFEVGRRLLDGPASEFFRRVVNAPVLAWFGLEHYATTGGIVLGLAFGLLCGAGLVFALKTTRRKLAGLEQGSERYKQLMARRSVRTLSFVFLGGRRGKRSYTEILEHKTRSPVRLSGLAAIAALLVAAFLAKDLLATPVVTQALKRELEQANGATVDLGAVELDLLGGRLAVSKLAMADPEALDTDLFRAGLLEADLDLGSLLRKELHVERLVVRDAITGATRETPGERLESEPDEAPEAGPPRGGEKTLEDYLEKAQTWRERLARARRTLEKLAGEGSDGDEPAAREESLEEWLERSVDELGHARVAASHLLEQVPSLTVSMVEIGGLRSAAEGELLDVEARDLSTDPTLLDNGPSLSVRSRSGRMALDVRLDARDRSADRLSMDFTGLELDALVAQLALDRELPVSGGTVDLAFAGGWGSGGLGELDLPLRVILRDTTVALEGDIETQVEEFPFSVLVRGPLDDPRLRVDGELLEQELLALARERAEDELKAEAERRLEEGKGELKDKLEEELEGELGESLGKSTRSILSGFGG